MWTVSCTWESCYLVIMRSCSAPRHRLPRGATLEWVHPSLEICHTYPWRKMAKCQKPVSLFHKRLSIQTWCLTGRNRKLTLTKRLLRPSTMRPREQQLWEAEAPTSAQLDAACSQAHTLPLCMPLLEGRDMAEITAATAAGPQRVPPHSSATSTS